MVDNCDGIYEAETLWLVFSNLCNDLNVKFRLEFDGSFASGIFGFLFFPTDIERRTEYKIKIFVTLIFPPVSPL